MPGTRCNILTCSNSLVVTKRQNIPKISYHKFPKVKEVRDIWIESCKRPGKWNYESCHICSIHFDEDDYERDLQAELLGIYRRKVLKRGAVPTKNLPDFEEINNIHVLDLDETPFDTPEYLYLKMSPAISSKKDEDDTDSGSTSSDTLDSTVVDLDSEDEDDDPLQPVQPTPEMKRIAKKSTVSLSYRQPPAAATRRKVALANSARKSIGTQDKFLENFDPERSAREKRKLNRKVSAVVSGGRKVAGAVYDEFGVHMATGSDLCDCLQKSCPGCHFPCPKCKSTKCGPECRCSRKYTYEQIEYHGCDLVIKNPLNK